MKNILPFAGIGTLAAASLLTLSLFHTAPSIAHSNPPMPLPTPTPIQEAGGTYHPGRSFAPLVKAVEPAVIAIEVERSMQTASANPGVPPALRDRFPEMFPDFADPRNGPQIVRGEGSGFVISADGLVLTNHHVVHQAERLRARFSDGTVVPLTRIGSDERTDVAILQLPKTKRWAFVELDESGLPEVGDWMIAMGNPLGLGTTVTAGILSGTGRDLPDGSSYDQFLQTDAAINQGNSGGPLFNLNGKVVGMNTAIIQGANTVGFAIPVSIITRVKQDLLEHGYVSRGFIGVSTQPLNPELATAFGLSLDVDGALVSQVYAGTPAAKAQLQQGDLIVGVDNSDIHSPGDLQRKIGEHHPGDKVSIRVIRSGKPRTVRATLAELPNSEAEMRKAFSPEGKKTHSEHPLLSQVGLELTSLSSQLAAEHGVKHGVLVQAVQQGSAVDGHLRAGDILVQVNKHAVDRPEQVSQILSASRGMVSFLIVRGDRQMYVALTLP